MIKVLLTGGSGQIAHEIARTHPSDVMLFSYNKESLDITSIDSIKKAIDDSLPDYVINAGGLIFVAAVYDHADMKRADKQVEDIYFTLEDIFARSQKENVSTCEIAERIALDRLA